LDVAEESLQNLGYPLQEAPSILDREDFGSGAEPASVEELVEVEQSTATAPDEAEFRRSEPPQVDEAIELEFEQPAEIPDAMPEPQGLAEEFELTDLQPEADEQLLPAAETVEAFEFGDTSHDPEDDEVDFTVDWSEAQMV